MKGPDANACIATTAYYSIRGVTGPLDQPNISLHLIAKKRIPFSIGWPYSKRIKALTWQALQRGNCLHILIVGLHILYLFAFHVLCYHPSSLFFVHKILIFMNYENTESGYWRLG